jgi:hypothetical protein
MKTLFQGTFFLWLLVSCSGNRITPPIASGQVKYKDYSKGDSLRLSNRYFPEFGVQNWREEDFFTDSYIQMIDEANEKTPYNFLIPFLRFPHYEATDSIVHDYVKRVAEYAALKNVQLVPDLDIRNARRAYKEKYPDELQKMLRLKETGLQNVGATEVVIRSIDLNDHYSGGALTHHISLEGNLLRVYAYKKSETGILSETLRDITSDCETIYATGDSVGIRIPVRTDFTHASVLVTFTHLYPDIFGPHLMEFQRKIIEQYRDVPLIGVCKDEWGFPPYYPRFFREGLHDFWYSEHRAKIYFENTGGRDLPADCLLMAIGEQNRDSERKAAINKFMEMSLSRHTALETDFYNTVKAVFGKDAVVTVHSTWWPYPDKCEFLKNGLDWWTAKRDWAQTDEVTPYAVRTALCKKWGSPVWYNMYYKMDLIPQMWSSALGGGRIDYLPYQSLFHPEVMLAECRIRLLNYIIESPMDCPVAVIFGHYGAMNWAGAYYNDTGMELVDSLWHTGYPTDLIPTTEIANGSLTVDENGTIWYGKQAYAAVVLYHPEFENAPIAEFFNNASKGNTALFCTGEWTEDFDGKPIDGNHLLPASMTFASDAKDAFIKVCRTLKEKHIPKQTPATGILDNTYFQLRDFEPLSCAPPTTGFSRMIDGTVIQIAGTNNISGDTMQTDFKVNNYDVFVDAVGVAAVRLDENGNPEALAAGGLKSFKAGNLEIRLNDRTDLALWKNTGGKWQGVIQGWDGPLPDALMQITSNWNRLNVPVPPDLNFHRR